MWQPIALCFQPITATGISKCDLPFVVFCVLYRPSVTDFPAFFFVCFLCLRALHWLPVFSHPIRWLHFPAFFLSFVFSCSFPVSRVSSCALHWLPIFPRFSCFPAFSPGTTFPAFFFYPGQVFPLFLLLCFPHFLLPFLPQFSLLTTIYKFLSLGLLHY